MGLNMEQKKERSKYLETNLVITECSQRKPYAFISYASDNWETVFKSGVVLLQKQHGLRVYADKAFDKVNDKWIVPMLRNVRGAEVMIVFISQSYIESYACFLELLTAVNSRKQIVFVSLGEQLHLGDTTDQPHVERGVKNEILNQGANLSTNTNNTSNDIMRAMKSAYTSLSTLLEQDALSKYDISDAFINFFRDASVNQKIIQDLDAVLGTIESISCDVFDSALIAETIHTPIAPVQESTPQSVFPQEQQIESIQSVLVESEIVDKPEVQPENQPEVQPENQPENQSEAQPENQSEAQPENQPEVQPENQSEAQPEVQPNPALYVQTEAAQHSGSPVKATSLSLQSKAKDSKLKQQISEIWEERSDNLASVGISVGVLSFVLAFVIPGVGALLALFGSIFGIVCGVRSLKSGKKALSIVGIVINMPIPLLLLLVIIAALANL